MKKCYNLLCLLLLIGIAAFPLGCDGESSSFGDDGVNGSLSAAADVDEDTVKTLEKVELTPEVLDFYAPPSTLPDGVHGDLIKCHEASLIIPGAPEFNAWTVMYHSTDALGNANVVTGAILIPQEAWNGSGERPIITYAVGTHGLAQECAPSLKMAQGIDYENSNYAKVLHEGYALLVSDNPGYTTGDIPTYMSGIAQGHAVLDIIGAALQVPETGLSEDAEVAIWGYSQGGQTAAWAGQLQPVYAPSIDRVGVAAGGVPADFFEVSDYLDGNNGSAFLLATVIGLWSQYPDGIPLEDLINDEGAEAVNLGLSTCVFEALFAFMNTELSNYVNGHMSLEELLAIPSVYDTLVTQELGNSDIEVPVYLYHGTADEFIPLEQSLDLKVKYCESFVNTTYAVFSGEHITTQFQAAPYVLEWLGDRFDGKFTMGTCFTMKERPVSTANPVDEDFIVSLNEWPLAARLHLKTLMQYVTMPEESTFSADTNMTTQTINGDLYIPKWAATIQVLIPLKVRMEITSAGPMTGTASIDNDGQLHIHGHAYVNIKITAAGLTNYTGIPIGVRTKEPVDFALNYDGPLSSLGDGTMTFAGETRFPSMTGGMLAPLFTTLMSGSGQEYTFTVSPPDPTIW